MKEQETLEMFEVWQPVEAGGEAIKADGTHMEKVATIVNGVVVYLKKDFYIQKRSMTQQEAENYQYKEMK